MACLLDPAGMSKFGGGPDGHQALLMATGSLRLIIIGVLTFVLSSVLNNLTVVAWRRWGDRATFAVFDGWAGLVRGGGIDRHARAAVGSREVSLFCVFFSGSPSSCTQHVSCATGVAGWWGIQVTRLCEDESRQSRLQQAYTCRRVQEAQSCRVHVGSARSRHT